MRFIGPPSRGQSEVLGFVLLIGMVVLSVTTLLIVGGGALDSLTEASNAENAEILMSQFDSEVSEVSLGNSERKQFQFSGEGTASVDETAGTITISQIGCGSCPNEILQTSLGEVRYTTGSTTVAFQGGGVWRTNGDHTTMTSPPEFHYTWGKDPSTNPTLTFPVVTVSGSEDISGQAQLTKGSSTSLFPNEAANLRNPLSSGSIKVTIESVFYQGWETYFRDRTSAETVDVDEDAQTVTAVLTIPNKGREIADGIATDGQPLSVKGSGAVDSYDSSKGSYADTKGDSGSVYVGDGLTERGGGEILGDMRVNGDYDGGGGVDVTGRLI
ncbi:hypothetical protein ACFSBT_04360, partial [Halomarina rubra]